MERSSEHTEYEIINVHWDDSIPVLTVTIGLSTISSRHGSTIGDGNAMKSTTTIFVLSRRLSGCTTAAAAFVEINFLLIFFCSSPFGHVDLLVGIRSHGWQSPYKYVFRLYSLRLMCLVMVRIRERARAFQTNVLHTYLRMKSVERNINQNADIETTVFRIIYWYRTDNIHKIDMRGRAYHVKLPAYIRKLLGQPAYRRCDTAACANQSEPQIRTQNTLHAEQR